MEHYFLSYGRTIFGTHYLSSFHAPLSLSLIHISQFFVILLFLMLGVLLYTFTAQQGIKNPDKSDEILPMIATGNYFPGIVGILFLSLIHI